MNIGGVRSNFVDCESSLDVLALCETNLDDSIDSGYFSVRGYLPLIRKNSDTHVHGLAVTLKKDFLLHISRKVCRFFLIFPMGFTSLNVLLLFPLSITLFAFVHSFCFYFI